MQTNSALQSISDDELLRRLGDLIQASRRVESDLVAHIAEVDGRRLYAREASPSMFAYCTEVLHLSEAESYLRIAAARASREHPMLLEMLADGRLHLSGISRLAPHLTRENAEVILKRAVHKSKRQIEELIAELAPRPDVPAAMRKLPVRREQTRPTSGARGARAVALDDTREEAGLSRSRYGLEPSIELRPERVATSESEPRLDGADVNQRNLRPEGGSASPAIPDGRTPSPVLSPGSPAVVQPLAPGRYRVQFTASAELHHKLERLRALMRSKVPDSDLAAIIEEAVTEKLERLEARRFATTKNPRKGLSKTDTSLLRAGFPPPSGVRCGSAMEADADT
jgi:hypothetical protein